MKAALRTSFFAGIQQRELPIRQYSGKSPMFFHDARIIGAIFPVDFRAAQALLPDPRLHALGLRKRAFMGVFGFSYGDTDLGPYQEAFVAIAVQSGHSRLPSLLRLAGKTLARSMDAHIIQLPVDSEAALYGGIDYYNVPKFMAALKLQDKAGSRSLTVSDPQNGELIFAMRSQLSGKRTHLPMPPLRLTLRNFSLVDSRLAAARYLLHAPNAMVALHRSHGPTLTIGTHARSHVLAALKPGKAIASFSEQHGEAILYEPKFYEGS